MIPERVIQRRGRKRKTDLLDQRMDAWIAEQAAED